VRQEFAPVLVFHHEKHRSFASHLALTGRFGVEMVFTGFAGNQLAIFGNSQPLSVRLVSFHKLSYYTGKISFV
jgi:hypothetical protein